MTIHSLGFCLLLSLARRELLILPPWLSAGWDHTQVCAITSGCYKGYFYFLSNNFFKHLSLKRETIPVQYYKKENDLRFHFDIFEAPD